MENNAEFKAFQKRKQTILKNVDRLLEIKFPNDMSLRQSYKEEVERAMNEEEAVVKSEIKVLKNRKSSIMIRKK